MTVYDGPHGYFFEIVGIRTRRANMLKSFWIHFLLYVSIFIYGI
jgi:hypothetical protein